MSDKPIDKPDNNVDDQEFSLNKFDLSDEDDNKSDDFDMTETFNALIEENEAFELSSENSKQEPSIPDLFETAKVDVIADEINAVDDTFLVSSDVEQPIITPALDPLEDDSSSSPELAQEKSGHKMMFVFAAILIAVFVTWFVFNTNDEGDLLDQKHSRVVLSVDVQMQRIEKKISKLQERLSSMQQKVILKDEKIAELTHLLAEQSLQQKNMHMKQAIVKKKESAIKKPVQKVIAAVIPIGHKHAGVWGLVVVSLPSRAAAEKALAELKAKGIAAEIKLTTVKGKVWFRVRVGGFASRAEAELQKKYLEKQHAIKGMWVHKLQ